MILIYFVVISSYRCEFVELILLCKVRGGIFTRERKERKEEQFVLFSDSVCSSFEMRKLMCCFVPNRKKIVKKVRIDCIWDNLMAISVFFLMNCIT